MRPSSRLPAALAAGLIVLAAACQTGVEMWQPCRPARDGNPTGTDGAYVLVCSGGRWVPVMTVDEYVALAQGRSPRFSTLPTPPTTTTTTSTSTSTTTTLPPSPSTTVDPPDDPVDRAPVLLLGDSLAVGLSGPLGDLLADEGFALTSGAVSGCGVIRGDTADATGVPLDITSACGPAIPPSQEDRVEAVHPVLVVLVSTWESADRVVDGQWHPYGSPEADSLVLDLYGETIDRLTTGGARVALVTVPPPTDSPLGAADADAVWRIDHLNELLDAIAAGDPDRVSLVRMDDIVCPADPCPSVVDGIALRPDDGVHFDPVGARYVADRLVPRILEVPVGEVG